VTVLLDSSFVIDHLRGQPAAVERWARLFLDGEQACVNEIVVCEVRAGLHPEEESFLTTLLQPIEFVQPGPDGAMLAGRWRADARRRGFTLSLADALIAAAAESVGAAVLTRNVRDFELTPVRVQSY
jgi:predicted nucleic acid-binding protein